MSDPDSAKLADPWDPAPLLSHLKKFGANPSPGELSRIPSFDWVEPGALASHLLVRLKFRSHAQAREFRTGLRASSLKATDYGFGPDPIISDLESWSPLGPGGGIFGNRDAAEDLTRVAALRGATGKGVNVIIVDRGLSRDWVTQTTKRMASRRRLLSAPPAQDVFGWTRYEWSGQPPRRVRRSIFPGATGSDHAEMVARNVLAIAPEATIWDAPLLPRQDEQDAPPGPSTAAHLFHWIKQVAQTGIWRSWDTRLNALVEVSASKPLVVVNAWGVLDPESEPGLKGYADDPDHFLINDMTRLTKAGIDVIFAAGNCGEACPDRRCGQQDTGPGRSILGLNAHPDVLTVGAVRVDGIPIAMSAQGPGRLATVGSRGTDYSGNRHAIDKPDVCAPSHFRESDDASELNTGTSAACGFAAGMVAAIRSLPAGRRLTPAKLRDLLRRTAHKTPGATGDRGAKWDPRLGFGILNAAAVLSELGGSVGKAD